MSLRLVPLKPAKPALAIAVHYAPAKQPGEPRYSIADARSDPDIWFELLPNVWSRSLLTTDAAAESVGRSHERLPEPTVSVAGETGFHSGQTQRPCRLV